MIFGLKYLPYNFPNQLSKWFQREFFSIQMYASFHKLASLGNLISNIFIWYIYTSMLIE